MTFSPDCEFITSLPEGYDERATLALGPGNVIVLAHPDMPPLVLNEQTRKFEEIGGEIPNGLIRGASHESK